MSYLLIFETASEREPTACICPPSHRICGAGRRRRPLRVLRRRRQRHHARIRRVNSSPLDLGDLGLDAGAHLLLRRAPLPLRPGDRLSVHGRDPSLRAHLTVWRRAEGHRLEQPDTVDGDQPDTVIVRGDRPDLRWLGAVRAGDTQTVVNRPPALWGTPSWTRVFEAACGARSKRGTTRSATPLASTLTCSTLWSRSPPANGRHRRSRTGISAYDRWNAAWTKDGAAASSGSAFPPTKQPSCPACTLETSCSHCRSRAKVTRPVPARPDHEVGFASVSLWAR